MPISLFRFCWLLNISPPGITLSALLLISAILSSLISNVDETLKILCEYLFIEYAIDKAIKREMANQYQLLINMEIYRLISILSSSGRLKLEEFKFCSILSEGYKKVEKFKIQSSRFKVQSSRFEVRGSCPVKYGQGGGCAISQGGVQGLRFKVQGSRFGVVNA